MRVTRKSRCCNSKSAIEFLSGWEHPQINKVRSKTGSNFFIMFKNKKTAENLSGFFQLTYKDSNLERLNQNQMCYHYTIGQYLYCACKSKLFFYSCKRIQKKYIAPLKYSN